MRRYIYILECKTVKTGYSFNKNRTKKVCFELIRFRYKINLTVLNCILINNRIKCNDVYYRALIVGRWARLNTFVGCG